MRWWWQQFNSFVSTKKEYGSRGFQDMRDAQQAELLHAHCFELECECAARRIVEGAPNLSSDKRSYYEQWGLIKPFALWGWDASFWSFCGGSLLLAVARPYVEPQSRPRETMES